MIRLYYHKCITLCPCSDIKQPTYNQCAGSKVRMLLNCSGVMANLGSWIKSELIGRKPLLTLYDNLWICSNTCRINRVIIGHTQQNDKKIVGTCIKYIEYQTDLYDTFLVKNENRWNDCAFSWRKKKLFFKKYLTNTWNLKTHLKRCFLYKKLSIRKDLISFIWRSIYQLANHRTDLHENNFLCFPVFN